MTIDWAVVLATIVGPIAAVQISAWREDRKAKTGRRHQLFAVLMGLRGASLMPEHVRALNLVQVEFHDDAEVMNAWKRFLAHLEIERTLHNATAWDVGHRDLLGALLKKMADSLHVTADAVDITRGGYYPEDWARRSQQERAVLEAKAKVADHLLSKQFDEWVKRMGDADYRAAFTKAANDINSKPSPMDRGAGPF